MGDNSDEYQFSITSWGYNFSFILTCMKFILKSIFSHLFCFNVVTLCKETVV